MGDCDTGQQKARWLEHHLLPLEPWLRRRIRYTGCAASDVDDIVQECFLRILAAHSAEHVPNPRGLLARVARNLMIDRHRHRARFEHVGLETAIELPGSCCPQEAFDTRRAVERVGAAFEGLPARRREIVERRRFTGQSSREVALALGITVSAIEKNLRMGIEALRRARDVAPGDYAGA
jgi:RNA polymerase sigma factor (sigma-70 family)